MKGRLFSATKPLVALPGRLFSWWAHSADARKASASRGLQATEKWVVFLLVATVALLPFSRLAELPIVILSFMGLWQLARSLYWRALLRRAVKRQRVFWSNPAVWVLAVVYLAYAWMVAASALDSYWPEKTWQVAVASLRFWLAGIAVVTGLRSPAAIDWVIRWAGLLAAFWVIDALFQYFVGFNLLGRETDALRLSGIFGAGHIKLGPVLAFLLPFLLAASRSWPVLLRVLVLLAAVSVIALTGTRSAWLMTAFVLLAWWWRHTSSRRWPTLLVSGAVLSGLLLALWHYSPSFHQRVARTLVAMQGSQQAIDYALADRLPIWEAGWQMFRQHPVNGVGAHAFRKAYPAFAPADNVWQEQGGTAMHAHHWLLEILAETGVMGLLAFALAAGVLFRWLRRCGLNPRNEPFVLALLSMFLPFVSTYSLFASFWAICVWWVGVGLLAATAITCRQKVAHRDAQETGSPEPDGHRTDDRRASGDEGGTARA